jgi:Fe(3+) dicitrate transport protein
MPVKRFKLALLGGAMGLLPLDAIAQEEDAPTLPDVQVIQPEPEPEPVAEPAPAPAPPPRVTATPAPRPAAPPPLPVVEPGPARDASGRVIDNAPAMMPINPTTIIPSDLSDFAGAATRVTRGPIDEDRPLTTQEELTRVPGVIAITDDGMGRHTNIGIRGSSARRARKVLMLEDGVSINFSTYIDPSTHYTPPLDRIEEIEVIRGTVVTHGPLNNFGIVNFRNLSPFGPEQTVIKGALGTNDANYRHAHTRQHVDNVGVVFSYSGMDADGVFDLERLRYNDFYGAVGWKGTDQDLTISGLYFRQRDNYDERNLELDEFENNPRCKKDRCMNAVNRRGNRFNTYNADLWMGQVVHNYYYDADTTITSRIYGYDQERARFESRRGGPRVNPPFVVVEGNMRGRDRHYQHYGAESAIELANRPFLGGKTQDIQAGVRLEYHEFRNCNTSGRRGEVLDWNNRGNCYATAGSPAGDPFLDNGKLETYDALAFSAFLQSAIHVNDALTVVPGIRFESWDLERKTLHSTDATVPLPFTEKRDYNEALPGVGFSWGFGQKPKDWSAKDAYSSNSRPEWTSTFYGGYYRGLGIPVARGAALAALEPEIGNNFQLGLRSTAIKGVTLDGAWFHNRISNYQIKAAGSDALGNNIFNEVDLVTVDGFELYGRLDTLPYTGWSSYGKTLNPFFEGTFTYAHSEIAKDRQDPSIVGNLVPEVPREFANLTAGIEVGRNFNASVTWTYRGSFFTDLENTVPISADGEEGKVDSVWLLSARANYTIKDKYTFFVSGQNLTDELYIADLSDGIKPGMGRTVMAGLSIKWGGDGPALGAAGEPAYEHIGYK